MRSAALCTYSAELDFLFGIQKSLRAFLNPLFTGGVVEGSGICSAAFCESAALRGYPFRLAASRQATFPKGTAFVVAGSFAAVPKGVPLGELAR